MGPMGPGPGPKLAAKKNEYVPNIFQIFSNILNKAPTNG